MRRATVTIPDDLGEALDAFLSSQPAPPSLAAVVQSALRCMLQEPEAHPPALLTRVVRHRSRIRELARRHGAESIALLGSAARAEDSAGSDLDFMVTMEPGRTLFDLARLRGELEDLLGVGVDVVSTGGLGPEMREELAAEAIVL